MFFISRTSIIKRCPTSGGGRLLKGYRKKLPSRRPLLLLVRTKKRLPPRSHQAACKKIEGSGVHFNETK
jgi:hypothetical protein